MLVANSLFRGLFYTSEHSLAVFRRVREGPHFTGGWLPVVETVRGLGGSQNEGLGTGAFWICAWTEKLSLLPNIGLNDKERLLSLIQHHVVACSSPGYSLPAGKPYCRWNATSWHPLSSVVGFMVRSQGKRTLDTWRQSFVCLEIVLGFRRGSCYPMWSGIISFCIKLMCIHGNHTKENKEEGRNLCHRKLISSGLR